MAKVLIDITCSIQQTVELDLDAPDLGSQIDQKVQELIRTTIVHPEAEFSGINYYAYKDRDGNEIDIDNIICDGDL